MMEIKEEWNLTLEEVEQLSKLVLWFRECPKCNYDRGANHNNFCNKCGYNAETDQFEEK
jgi:hypothetical protein